MDKYTLFDLRKINYDGIDKELGDGEYDKKVVKIVKNEIDDYDNTEEIAIEFTPRNGKRTFPLSEIFKKPDKLGHNLKRLDRRIRDKGEEKGELDRIREELKKQIEVPLTQELVDDIKFIKGQLKQKTTSGGKRKSRRNQNPKKSKKGKSSRRNRRRTRRSRKTSRR